MTTKGAFTQIDTSGDRAIIVTRKVLYMDGYDAFVCAISGRGETEKRTGKPTAYAFTYDQTKHLIYLSEGYRSETMKNTVRERTLTFNRYDAGLIISSGITLKWLTPEENEQLKQEYLQKSESVTETLPQTFGGDTGKDADVTPEPTEGAREDETSEIRYRCADCGNLIPKGRKKCRKCGSKNLVQA
jgi:hypothetical protein